MKPIAEISSRLIVIALSISFGSFAQEEPDLAEVNQLLENRKLAIASYEDLIIEAETANPLIKRAKAKYAELEEYFSRELYPLKVKLTALAEKSENVEKFHETRYLLRGHALSLALYDDWNSEERWLIEDVWLPVARERLNPDGFALCDLRELDKEKQVKQFGANLEIGREKLLTIISERIENEQFPDWYSEYLNLSTREEHYMEFIDYFIISRTPESATQAGQEVRDTEGKLSALYPKWRDLTELRSPKFKHSNHDDF